MNQDQLINIARNHASEEAHEAREEIFRMPGKQADYLLVLDGLIEVMASETWGDFSDVLDALEKAFVELGKVRAYTDDERAQWAKERMA